MDCKYLQRYALSMEDKMAAGAFGRATNYGRTAFLMTQSLKSYEICEKLCSHKYGVESRRTNFLEISRKVLLRDFSVLAGDFIKLNLMRVC